MESSPSPIAKTAPRAATPLCGCSIDFSRIQSASEIWEAPGKPAPPADPREDDQRGGIGDNFQAPSRSTDFPSSSTSSKLQRNGETPVIGDEIHKGQGHFTKLRRAPKRHFPPGLLASSL